MRLDRGFVVFPCGKASCRTVVGFPDSQFGSLLSLLFGQIPDAALCVAEAGERTIFLIIGQRDFGSVDLFRILEKRTGRGREGRVPVGVFVRTVAIRLVFGISAATQCCGFVFGGVVRSLLEIPDFAFAVGHDKLLYQRRLAINQIRTAVCDDDAVFFGSDRSSRFDLRFHKLVGFKDYRYETEGQKLCPLLLRRIKKTFFP